MAMSALAKVGTQLEWGLRLVSWKTGGRCFFTRGQRGRACAFSRLFWDQKQYRSI